MSAGAVLMGFDPMQPSKARLREELERAIAGKFDGVFISSVADGTVVMSRGAAIAMTQLLVHLDRQSPERAIDAVRARIYPGTIIRTADLADLKFPKKAIFNALTHLAGNGELEHVSYGKYRAPLTIKASNDGN